MNITPVTTLPANGVTTGALQTAQNSARLYVKSSGAAVVARVIEMLETGDWVRTNYAIILSGQGAQYLDFPVADSGAYFHVLLDGAASTSGFTVTMKDLIAPSAGGVGGSASITPAVALPANGSTAGAMHTSTNKVRLTVKSGGSAAVARVIRMMENGDWVRSSEEVVLTGAGSAVTDVAVADSGEYVHVLLEGAKAVPSDVTASMKNLTQITPGVSVKKLWKTHVVCPPLPSTTMVVPGDPGTGSTYRFAIELPPDSTQLEVYVGNRYNGGLFPAGGALNGQVAVYMSDGSGAAGTLLFNLNRNIPSDGSLLKLDNAGYPFPITLPSDHKIVVIFSLQSTVTAVIAGGQHPGFGDFTDGLQQVNPAPAIGSPMQNLPLWWAFAVKTSKDQYLVLGDSISAGETTSGNCGFDNAAFYKLAHDKGVAVQIEGQGGQALGSYGAYVTNPALWDYTFCVLDPSNTSGFTAIIQAGENDLGYLDLPTIKANFIATVNHLRSVGAGKIFVNTIAPQQLYAGAETIRTSYNAFLRANSMGLDGVCDLAASHLQGGLADDVDSTILYAPYSADGTHRTAAGQAAEEALWISTIGL